MKVSWIFLLAVGIASADIGLKLRKLNSQNKLQPQTSYEAPTYNYADGGNYGSGYGSYANGALGSYASGRYSGSAYPLSSSGSGDNYYQSANGFEKPYNYYSDNSGVSNGYQSANSFEKPYNYYSENSGLSNGYQSQYSASRQYQSSGQENYQQSYQIQQQAPVVYKHFYVHAAPEEPEVPQVRTPIVLPPAQKHYKIIFVKVPSEGLRSQAIIPIQQQNEEKTIVYVLVKKPEEQHELIVPKVDQKPPTKPEVFFIKYKNKEDSQAVIDNIVKDYNKGQNVISTFNSAVGQYNNVAGPVDSAYSSANSFGTEQYETPLQSEVSANAQSYAINGNQGAVSLASVNSGGEYNDATLDSSVAPITFSSTGSSLDYDGASAVANSQGVPFETYGAPKYRVD